HAGLGFDEGADPAPALRLGDPVVDERRLPRGLRAEDLDVPSARQAADPEREVERERSGRHGADRDGGLVAHSHHGSLAELPLDLAEGDVESLLAIHLRYLLGQRFRELRTAPPWTAAPNDRERRRTDRTRPALAATGRAAGARGTGRR